MTHPLDQIHEFLGRFIAYPSEHAHIAHTLWVVHTHLMDCWESTPRIAFLSPEPGSGKTRALEITELLVPNPVEAVNVTPAYLFRKVGDDGEKPTVLFDEIDTVFGPKAKDNEEIRGLLNAGHRRGAVAGRCVVKGRNVTTEEIPAYCAAALAGIGDLPDTLLSRSVVIRMRRRAPHEQVEPYRRRVHADEGDRIRFGLEDWAVGNQHLIDGSWPEMPEGVEDRDADVWEPLLAIADAAGGDWPQKARVSAVTLVTELREDGGSLGVRLLSDLRTVFGEKDAMTTQQIIDALCGLEEAPWGDLYGKPITARGLAKRLRKYEVSSRTIRIGDSTAKGYTREDLYETWQRYLPSETSQSGTETSHPLQKVTNVTDESPTNNKATVNVNYGKESISEEGGDDWWSSSHKSVTSVTGETDRLPGTHPDDLCEICDQPGYLVTIKGTLMHRRCSPNSWDNPPPEDIAP